jgi:hypothetical protein
MTERKPKPAARTHPDERSRITALTTISQALNPSAPEKPPRSYYTPILIQCTLPHSDPKERDWIKTNGNSTLIVSSGIDEKGTPYGIPYGSFPRLVMAYIITQVVQSQERRIELTSHFGGFLKEIGYTSNHRGSGEKGKRIRDQLMRLIMARITFQVREGTDEQGAVAGSNINVTSKYALWWDYKNPEQPSLFDSFLDLSEDFYNAILSAPVPLRTDILKALRKSPLALDVYMWISYRLYTLQNTGQEQVTLSYGKLQEQFGTGISEENYRSFRRELKLAFGKVAQYWKSADGEKQLLNYELHESGLTLYRSPLLIPIPRRKILESGAATEATRILAVKKFDDLTMKQARQAAGAKWDVQWLASQYFTWIENEAITPKDPRAHFLAFIKAHRERNEKAG